MQVQILPNSIKTKYHCAKAAYRRMKKDGATS